MLKIFAALVEVMATNSFIVRRPEFTPWCQRTCMRSSTPPVPLGICVKLLWPMRFCGAQKQQWSVAVVCSRSEEHTSELQSLMRISYAVFCLKKKKQQNKR